MSRLAALRAACSALVADFFGHWGFSFDLGLFIRTAGVQTKRAAFGM